MYPRTTRAAFAVLGACGALAVSACGSDAGEPLEGGGGEVPQVAQDASLDFAECMRKEGIDVPDPAPGSAGFSIGADTDIDISDPSFKRAENKCRHFLEEAIAGSGIERVTEIPDEAFDYAACMRDHGIDFPDPKVENGMALIGPEDETLDPDDPELQAAAEACRDHLPESDAPAP